MDANVGVIGGGPAGIFSALEAAKRGNDVVLYEKGDNFACSVCPSYERHLEIGDDRSTPGTCCGRRDALFGFGGSALHFEVTLDNYGTHPEFEYSSTLIDHFESKAMVERYVDEVYSRLFEHGLPQEAFERGQAEFALDHPALEIDSTGAVPIEFDDIWSVMESLEESLRSNGVEIRFGVEVTDIDHENGHWAITSEDPSEIRTSQVDNVVFATGKFCASESIARLNEFGVEYTYPESIYLGARIETPQEWLGNILSSYKNPKIWYRETDTDMRSFCFCDGGRMMRYTVEDTPLLDGEHGYSTKGPKTNFAIIKQVDVPTSKSSIEYGLAFAKSFNQLAADDHLPAQCYDDFVSDRPTADDRIQDVQTTLNRLTGANLKPVLDAYGLEVEEYLSVLKEELDSIPSKEILLTGPVVQKYLPRIDLDRSMESTREGLYFAGDCTGQVSGVISAAVTGLAAGRDV